MWRQVFPNTRVVHNLSTLPNHIALTILWDSLEDQLIPGISLFDLNPFRGIMMNANTWSGIFG